MKARVFNIMQYENHPTTGEPLLDETTIIGALSHKSIVRWTYICHDEDVYSERDASDDAEQVQGRVKPKHWHIVLQCSYAVDVSVIAKWFGIPENFVDVPKGAGAFLDCVQYLTHERDEQQALGKRLYPDEKVKANFDFRQELTERTERRLKYGRDLNPRDQLRYEVMYKGLTLRQAAESEPIYYMNDISYLRKCRADFLQNRAPLPKYRINYYIDGLGGIGKSVACRALARSLYPDLPEDECYFEVGGKGVSFDGYDGEPVIIWNDNRAIDLILKFGRGEVFDMLDTHPGKAKHNVKYDSVKLTNTYNIINGIESYTDFLAGLAGEYRDRDGNFYFAEDKSQAHRRFPIILCLHETDFDLLLNQGVLQGTREYDQYLATKNIQGSFAELAKRLEGRAKETVTISLLQSVLEATEKIKEHEGEKIEDPDELPEDFKGYGISQQDGGEVVTLTDNTDKAKSTPYYYPIGMFSNNEDDEIDGTPDVDLPF